MKFNSRTTTPILGCYKPELDQSQELNKEDITYFQEPMEMLRWTIKISQIDIYHEVSMIPTYQ